MVSGVDLRFVRWSSNVKVGWSFGKRNIPTKDSSFAAEESADSLEPPQSVCNSDDVLSVVSRYSNVPCWVLVDVSYTYGADLAFCLVRYETQTLISYGWQKSSS